MVEAVHRWTAAPQFGHRQPNHLLCSSDSLNIFSVLLSRTLDAKLRWDSARRNVEATPFGLFVRLVPMHGILQDFRYVLRQLPKDPVFGAVAILTLALAVGANTSIFSVIQTVLLNSLPYRDVHRLMMIWSQLV